MQTTHADRQTPVHGRVEQMAGQAKGTRVSEGSWRKLAEARNFGES